MRRLLYCCLACVLLLTTVLPLEAAGLSSPGTAAQPSSRYSVEQILKFSKKVEKILAGKGCYVALVARKGRPKEEMPEGMAFTHVGFAVYSTIATKDGRMVKGYAMYNAYQMDDKPNSSRLVKDFMADFFADVADMEAGVIIPSPVLQYRLLKTITSPLYNTFHDPRYSAIANPYTLGRQNCTEFVLDIIISSIYQTGDMRKIKAAEKQYYVAQKVNVNPLKLFFGSMFMREITLSDHPGTPVTATFETIADFLRRYDEGSEEFTVSLDQ
nr:DUF2145 domain-containing protein [uncultured Desulfobulbus sp.]